MNANCARLPSPTATMRGMVRHRNSVTAAATRVFYNMAGIQVDLILLKVG